MKSLQKGLKKLKVNEERIAQELGQNWVVVAEALQTILRREGYPQPYEALKSLTRGKGVLTQEDIHTFIDGLDIETEVKEQMKAITPFNYTGFRFF